MRFKIDENLPAEVAELLVAETHDAVTVIAQGLQGTQDTQLAQHLWIVEEAQIRIRGSER